MTWQSRRASCLCPLSYVWLVISPPLAPNALFFDLRLWLASADRPRPVASFESIFFHRGAAELSTAGRMAVSRKCIMGAFLEGCFEVFQLESANDSWITTDEAFRAMTSCGASVTYSQLGELLSHCAGQNRSEPLPGRENGDSVLLRGEFCWLVAAVQHLQRAKKQVGREGLVVDLRKRLAELSWPTSSSAPTVFLGGSCNPTTWRKDLAIPQLQAAGISFYNPQVDDWYPELIETERQSKEEARVLLFVVDDETRAVASMVEAAYLIGRARLVVLVIRNVTASAPASDGDVAPAARDKDAIFVCESEEADLNNSRAFLADIAEKCDAFVFARVDTALRCVVELLEVPPGRRGDSSVDAVPSGERRRRRHGNGNGEASLVVRRRVPDALAPHRYGNELLTLQQHFQEACENSVRGEFSTRPEGSVLPDTSSLPAYSSLPDKRTAAQCAVEDGSCDVANAKRAVKALMKRRRPLAVPMRDRDVLDYDVFCQLVAAHYDLDNAEMMSSRFGNGTAAPLLAWGSLLQCARLLFRLAWGVCQALSSVWYAGVDARQLLWRCSAVPYVFLGGSCGRSKWRTEIATPVLQDNGIQFYNPQVPRGWSTCRIPTEAYYRDRCGVLLVCITPESRSAGSMVEAAYSIGCGKEIVLSIEDLPADSCVDGEQMSARAIKDYNRGRAYLRELCQRHSVPFFPDVDRAVKCCVELLNKTKGHTSSAV